MASLMYWFLASAVLLSTFASGQIPGAENVTTVHFVSSCHLDIGFADSAANIVNRYFDHYFTESINVSATLRQMGGEERLVFLTHPYLISLYTDCPPGMGIHCPSKDNVSVFEDAIRRGDIVWHAMPFNSQLEVLDVSLLDFSIKLTHSLDKKYGKLPTTTMSQRDVPGMTRSIIPTLVANGVKAITVGVNGGSMPPAVPSVFVWHHSPTNQSILAMWHPGGYGGQHGVQPDSVVVVPGFSHALVYGFRGDNSGPPSAKEVVSDYATMRKLFPNVKQILVSNFDAFVQELETVQNKLPVVTQEIGDTWMYGVPSDPGKIAQYRELLRARSNCLQQKQCSLTDYRFFNFSRLLIKGAEHTWGNDVKKYLNDYKNWHNDQFHALLDKPNYVAMVTSWQEQRDWAINYAVEGLNDHPLRQDIVNRLAAMKGRQPSTNGFTKVANLSSVFKCGSFEIGFSPSTGAISHLTRKTTNTTITVATSDHPLAQIVYETFTEGDFEKFSEEYNDIDPKKNSWVLKDFGKPGLNGTLRQTVSPTISEFWHSNATNSSYEIFLLHLMFPDSIVKDYGGPVGVWEQVTVPLNSSDIITLELSLINKTATRIPESISVYFNPRVEDPTMMRLNKLGQLLDPVDVVVNGSRHLHGLSPTGGVEYGNLQFRSLDTSVVSIGGTNPFPVPADKPDLTKGFSFLISNNLWGTNYIMWYPFLPKDASRMYRMVMTIPDEAESK
ncbi:uncharacterized protein LOC134176140 [Corticium candelabrum]|uniref:uncharacterized protein LOC134176140 n=1 Tax=Corticium candelabrum TaxID=121492 RepID=UPI002E25CF3C|nr:uncharacterized protein LOC134176140 [Corticium candelabrum]